MPGISEFVRQEEEAAEEAKKDGQTEYTLEVSFRVTARHLDEAIAKVYDQLKFTTLEATLQTSKVQLPEPSPCEKDEFPCGK